MANSLFAFSKSFFHTLARGSAKSKKKASRWMRPSLMQLEDRLVLFTGLAGSGIPMGNMQPYLALNYLVVTNGIYPQRENPFPSTADLGYPVLGEVTLFAGNFAPSGYALAQGQNVSINQNTPLFSLLGDNFGGNFYTNFSLPDLQGRTAVGAGNGSGLTSSFVGTMAGTPTITETFENLPAHDHQLLNPATNPPTVTGTTGSTGSGTPLNNLMPTLALNYQVVANPRSDYTGEVALYAGFSSFFTDAAQGQLLSVSQNQGLFNKIGTTFGGDGVNNFALPDLQGRVAVGAGSGPGLSTYILGQTGGTETVTLSTNNLAIHQHLQLNTNTPTSLTGGSQPFSNVQPLNTLTYAICTNGIYPSQWDSSPPGEPLMGQIKMFASNSLPDGWLPCDGRNMPIRQYQALYTVVGSSFGGNGTTYFNLPDLRGRVPVGTGQDSFGNYYTLGQSGGTELNTMTNSTMAIHFHSTPAIVSITTTTSTAYESVAPNMVPNRHLERTVPAQSGSQLVYTITRDSTQGGGTVRLDVGGTSSTSDYHFVISSGATFSFVDADTIEINFPSNALEVALTASPIQDRNGEGRESLSLTLVPGGDFLLHFSEQSATGFILDADPLFIAGGGISGTNPSGAEVNLYRQPDGALIGSVVPYPGFHGEVRISHVDTTGDGIPEIITVPGMGMSPLVQVMNAETGAVLSSFLAYDASFTGGVFVSLQDMNQDGSPEFITSAGAGGGPHIKVFDGRTSAEIASFFAFDPGFRGGVSVATFDADGDGIVEIAVGAGPGGGPHVRVFGGLNHTLVKEFYAYDPSFTGGVFVAMGDIGVNGRVDLITGPGSGGGPHVKIWNYESLTVNGSIMAFTDPAFNNGLMVDILFQGGARVGVADYNSDGIEDVVVGAGPGGGPRVQVFSGVDFSILGDFFSGDTGFRGGVFVN